MKHLRTYHDFKNSINEELLGGMLNLLKGLWGKSVDELDKIGESPSYKDIKKWISDNPFNPSDNNYIFKGIMDDFLKKKEVNDEDCLSLIEKAIDPATGAIGIQGLNPLIDILKKKYEPKKGEKESSQLACFEFILSTVRTKTIIKFKYAGGPSDGKVDPNKRNMDINDTTHLPDVKIILKKSKDVDKKKNIMDFMNKIMFPQIDKFVDEIKDDDIKKYLDSKKITENTPDENTEK